MYVFVIVVLNHIKKFFKIYTSGNKDDGGEDGDDGNNGAI